MQGFAVRVHHEDIGTERFPEALKRILTEPSFKEAAKRVSRKLRARPRTPTQEAAGECFHAVAVAVTEIFNIQPSHTSVKPCTRPHSSLAVLQ